MLTINNFQNASDHQNLRNQVVEKLDDRYIIMNSIEANKMCHIRFCFDHETSQTFIVKFYITNNIQEHLNFMKQEVTSYLKANCDNIVKLIGYNFNGKLEKFKEIQQVKYILMENGEKGDLFRIIQEKKSFPIKIARFFFRQMVYGLKTLHSQNISHRDIKLENFVLFENFLLKYIDFAFSCEIRDKENVLIQHNKFIGTERYMAPEIFKRKYTVDKSDIYSLGVCLYIMISGKFPFNRAAFSDKNYLVFAINKEENIIKFWENQENKKFTSDCVCLLNKMFCADPAERYDLDKIINSDFFKGEIETTENLQLFFNQNQE